MHRYEYGFPLSCPVALSNGSEFLAGFDFSTTFLELADHVSEVWLRLGFPCKISLWRWWHCTARHIYTVKVAYVLCNAIPLGGSGYLTSRSDYDVATSKALGMRPSALTGFAIFTSVSDERDLFVSRKAGVKVCDALFEWEKAMKEATVGLLDASLVPIFNFQRRLYWSSADTDGDKGAEDVLAVYQIAHAVTSGSFHVELLDAIKMGSIIAQIDNGDLDAQASIVGGVGSYVFTYLAFWVVDVRHAEQTR